MITTAPRPDPRTFDLYEVVWDQYLSADKSPVQVLRASAAWISAQERGVTL
jgi:hypothetical protein